MVDVRSRAEAIREVLGKAEARQPLMVAFANAHSVNLAATDATFRSAMDEALLLNDGAGLEIASKLLFGEQFPDNLNGTDFVPALLGESAVPLRLWLIGGRPGIAERAGQAIARNCPNVTIVGAIDGYFDRKAEAGQCRQIAGSSANMVLLGLGQPLQEFWAQRHWRDIAGPCLCVGALLDFLAGNFPRAPHVLRRLRLEWAFRLFQEPRRLARRYLVGNVTFLARIARQRLVDRRH